MYPKQESPHESQPGVSAVTWSVPHTWLEPTPSKSLHCGASDRPRITTASTLGDGDGCGGKSGDCDGEGGGHAGDGGKGGGGGNDTQQPVQSQPEPSSSLQRSMP